MKLNYKGAAHACDDTGDLCALTVQPPGDTTRAGAKWWDSSQFVRTGVSGP